MTGTNNDTEADFEARLRSLDPVIADAAPGVGSTRYHEMRNALEANMTTTNEIPTNEIHTTGSRRHRGLALIGTAAVAVFAAVLFWPTSVPAVNALLSTAAENSAAATDFKVHLVTTDSFIPGGEARAVIDGDNVHMVSVGGFEFVRVDGVDWFGEGGEWATEPASNEAIAPFGEASKDLISAAIESEKIEEVGIEDIEGTTTTHYEIIMDDAGREALGSVPAESQFWFTSSTGESAPVDDAEGVITEEDLVDGDIPDGSFVDGDFVPEEVPDAAIPRSGFLDDADSISIWVADDLVYRIAVDMGTDSFTYTFSDFGVDNVVTAPEAN